MNNETRRKSARIATSCKLRFWSKICTGLPRHHSAYLHENSTILYEFLPYLYDILRYLFDTTTGLYEFIRVLYD